MPTPRVGESVEQMRERRRLRDAAKTKPKAAASAPVAVGFDRGRWADKTKSAYSLSWKHFKAHCAKPMPASAADIAAFLRDYSADHSTSTVSMALAAIKAAHEMHGHEIKVKGTAIADAWADIRRTKGTRKHPKKALTLAQVKAIAAKMPDTIRGQRDKTIFLFAVMSAMRRSEIASLNVEDLTFSEKGVLVMLRHSKTDKASKGQQIDVPCTGTALCPVTALRAWTKDKSGAVFRTERDTRIDGRAVADIVKAGVASIGLDPRLYAGHSTRRTYITLAFQGGARLEDIMKRSRHSTYDIARGYIEELDVFQNPADRAVGL
jgi:integrase